MSILLEKLAPITHSVGFIEAPLSIVDEYILPWQLSLKREISVEYIHLPLEDALPRLEPLSGSSYKNLWVETNSPWLASFSNSRSGGFGPVSYLAQLCKTRALEIICSPFMKSGPDYEKSKGTWGSTQFRLYGPEPRPILNGIRSIAVANDGGSWVFEANGEIQPFEQVDRYLAPRIRDRFTPEMLESYCRALGIDAFNESFYKPSAVLLEQSTRTWKKQPRTWTLAERRRELGLESTG